MHQSVLLVAILHSPFLYQQVECGVVRPNTQVFEICKRQADLDVILELSQFPIFKEMPSQFEDSSRQYLDALRVVALKIQTPIVQATERIVPHKTITKTFWVANRITLQNLPCKLLNPIIDIVGDFIVRHEEKPVPTDAFVGEAEDPTASVQWGVKHIKAPKVWPITKGAGVVVGSIDSGVRATHETLKQNWRGSEFGWLDGFTNKSDGVPIDETGSGTHSMGTIVGKMGVGVAPAATWMACKACNKTGCSEVALLTCAQWLMCPYKTVGNVTIENFQKRPRIVHNGWAVAGAESANFFNPVIQNWARVGIISVFQSGNRPKELQSSTPCSSVSSPADQDQVISVGASDDNDTVAVFSGRGPSRVTNLIKPEFVAPGVNIVSAWHTGDSNYSILNGTGMAAAHVTGTIALIISKNVNITTQQIMSVMASTTVRPATLKKHTCSCTGGLLEGAGCKEQAAQFPNNAYGHGIIDAHEAFSLVRR